ncbi:MAG TPA: BCAM0308 family protein [Blastocatellia bacterium]|nr:BCAM0308 family protein [Blastocatellia bacterium]
MRTSKRYTNTSFTKRVDHQERHVSRRAAKEPKVCSICGSVYEGRRWVSQQEALNKARPAGWKAVASTLCPACLQERSGVPGGVVYVDGEFLAAHRDEIQRIIENEAERAGRVNPLARILAWEKQDNERLTVTTTTEHLAQRLGHALEKAFGGEVRYGFSHENKFARVWWHRN